MDLAQKIKAIKAAAKKGGSQNLRKIISFLNDTDSTVRSQAVVSLGGFREEAAAKALALALKDKDSIVRCLACASLAKVGGEKALQALSKTAVDDSDPKVRKYASDAKKKLESSPMRRLKNSVESFLQPIAPKQDEDVSLGEGEEEIQEFEEEEKQAVFGKAEVEPVVMRLLETRGITKLYAHQAQALNLVRKGKSVVVTAPTASGKTEIFLIPAVESALKGRRTLVVYPTKALSRDQLDRFREFAILGVRTEVYDGDTPQSQRKRIRSDFPHVLITNFDMLHFMLMNSPKFKGFFSTLDDVVVDEVHTYSGTVGAHVANIIKRLKRVCRLQENERELRFICSSATVGNPKEFCEELVGSTFSLVDASKYAPRAKVTHQIANPPLMPNDRRASYTALTLRLVKKMLKEREKILVFGNSHSIVERLGLMAKENKIGDLRVYRAGLDQRHRKELEADFKAGRFKALASTSALELGMDIGSVDAVVLAGYPGTISRVRQRVGRCGRKGQDSVAVFVARDNPLDQYYVEQPKKYLHGAPESCFVNPENEFVLKWQLLALMRDHPASEEELGEFSAVAPIVFEKLKVEEMVRRFAGAWIPTTDGKRFLRTMGIRGSGDSVRIYDADKKAFIGHRDKAYAINELFPGAIYLHGGEKYFSESLDLEEGVARVRKAPSDLRAYTIALKEKTVEEIEVKESQELFGADLYYGLVHVREEVYGYMVKNYLTDEVLEKKQFEEPLENEFDTLAVWVDYPQKIVRSVSSFGDGLHAVEHCSIAMIPALCGTESNEIGGLSYPSGRMYIYDGVPQGSGATRVVFDRFAEMQSMALERLRNCKCKKGCPSCILDPQCGNNNKYLNKESAKRILSSFLDSK